MSPRPSWLALVVALVLAGCGARISIGEMPTETLGTDPVEEDAGAGARAPDGGAAPIDAGGAKDAGGGPDEDAGELDAGGWSPCSGKACGEPCKICPPGDPNCFETAVVKECNAAGQCSPIIDVCP